MNDFFTLEKVQQFFDTDIEGLIKKDEDDIEFIEQCHSGDLLIESINNDGERFKLWRNLDCNDANIEIEYLGRLNKYTWETVLILDLNNY